MNNLYQWHNEAMVTLKIDDLRREMDKICLLHDACLSNPGWFERTVIAIGNSFVKIGKNLHKKYTAPTRSYQITSSKYAA